MAVFTDLTGAFAYKNLLTWQLLDELGQNDVYLNNQVVIAQMMAVLFGQ